MGQEDKTYDSMVHGPHAVLRVNYSHRLSRCNVIRLTRLTTLPLWYSELKMLSVARLTQREEEEIIVLLPFLIRQQLRIP